MRATTMYRITDSHLGGELESFVLTRRAAGMSWRRIALEIYEATDRVVDISYEALRSWFGDNGNGR